MNFFGERVEGKFLPPSRKIPPAPYRKNTLPIEKYPLYSNNIFLVGLRNKFEPVFAIVEPFRARTLPSQRLLQIEEISTNATCDVFVPRILKTNL